MGEAGIQNNEFFFINNPFREILGMVRILKNDLEYWGEQNHTSVYIHSLVIKGAYGGKGIGKLVLQKNENGSL